MTWLRIVAVGLAVLLYLRSPIDLLPDRFGPIGLLDDLAVLLTFVWYVYRRAGRTHPPPATHTTENWDPYAVLGVAHDASPEQVTHAYREQMKRYHPDRVADLGEELQQLAHRKAIEIQRAYSEIGRG
jgi:DnaJ-domain-containing protein 1